MPEGSGRAASALRAVPFGRFVDESDDLFTLVDTEGRFLYVSRAGRRVFGVEPEACVGRSAFDFVHPDDRDETRAAFGSWVADPGDRAFHYENRQQSQGGDVRRLVWTINKHRDDGGHLLGFHSTARDVTERRGVEARLTGSEARVRALLAGMLDPVVTIDASGTVREASRSVRDAFGWEPEELVGENVRVLMPEPHHSRHDDYLRSYLETGSTWILGTTREFEVVRKDGERILCELSVSRVDVPGDDEPSFIGSFRDVTARRRAERELAQRERLFHSVFDHEFQYVALVKPDGAIVETNRASLAAVGLTLEDVVGSPLWDMRWWRDPETCARIREAVGRAAQGELVRFETSFLRGSGERAWVDFSIKPLFDDDGRVTLLIPEGRDITGIRRAQERETNMLRALATLGESAALLAHEIKNPITAINLALRAVAGELGEDHRVVLGELVGRMQKLERSLRRTLSFARPLDLHRAEVDVSELVRAVALGLRPQLAAQGTRLDVDAEEGPTGSVDAGLVEEIVANLITNAAEALEEGGRVRVSTRAAPEGRIRVDVEDDGPGLPEGAGDALFHPFFTTKSTGTGLGLAICRKIALEHGGDLEADASELGGARFRLTLPAL